MTSRYEDHKAHWNDPDRKSEANKRRQAAKQLQIDKVELEIAQERVMWRNNQISGRACAIAIMSHAHFLRAYDVYCCQYGEPTPLEDLIESTPFELTVWPEFISKLNLDGLRPPPV